MTIKLAEGINNISQEEIFGSMLAVIKSMTFDESLMIAN
jgi:acyl-CoA reductase-like NAD-dependent aldehyde dehydrogenase